MTEVCVDNGVKAPVFSVQDNNFAITFYYGNNRLGEVPENDIKNVPENHPENHLENHLENLTNRQKDIYDYLKQHPEATISDIVANVESATMGGLKYNINVLKRKGLIVRIGPDKGGYWQAVENKMD